VSLQINEPKITRVLLADGWHECTGFAFIDTATGQQIAGPLTAILAVAGDGITKTPEPADPDIHR
jgi:hypothetical protein